MAEDIVGSGTDTAADESVVGDDNAADVVASDTGQSGPDDADTDDTDAVDTFSREYVTELRQESAEHRRRAVAAEERVEALSQTLWHERVTALNLLADAADLPYDADALDDPAEIRRQADELLARRPHLRTRRITARAGQGEGENNGAVSLTGIMRAHA